jgi:hypothetical protein
MTKNNKKFWNGFWDKEECGFRVLEIIVGKTPENIQKMYEDANPGKRRYPWYEAFIGENMQVIEIHANNIKWFINNSDGKGLVKLTNVVGKDDYGHKGIYAEKIIREVPMKEWVRHNQFKEQELNDKIDAFFMKAEPFLYPKHKEEMISLRNITKEGGMTPVKDGDSKESDDGETTTVKLN